MTDIKITEVDADHVQKKIDTMYDLGIELAKAHRSFVRWMTTSSFAVLGFYLTVLFQIKSKMDVPLPKTAGVTFALLLFCVLTGIYARFRFELGDWFGKFREMILSAFNVLQIAINNYHTEELTPEAITSANQRIEKANKMFTDVQTMLSKLELGYIILVQIVSLSLGVIAVSFYIFYYLFIFNVLLK
jgi:hypothetical protein